MELKTFIKGALTDIMDAVQETIEERAKDGKHGYVNPKSHADEGMEIDTIKFDIAVTASSKRHGSGKAGINVHVATIGADGAFERESSNLSRIEFTLSVAWPHTHIMDAKKLHRAK
ncbi:hypothetical protein QBK99_25170 [Corticibacterium sp. UT-5YL-CI-8]|nr:hypothetical protein [Tianweitania sp. UT-5YL-CI-8]